MKKKYILKNKRRFIIALAIVISILSSIFLVATTKTEGYSEVTYKEVVISSGDTLWDIVCETYGNNIDVRKKVSVVKKANEMLTSELFVGQVLLLPEE